MTCVETKQRVYYDEARFPHCPTCEAKLGYGFVEYGESYDTCVLCTQKLSKETCGQCKNCSPIANVAGADCHCEANSEYDEQGALTLQFEVSQTDDISFYGDSEPCKHFSAR